MFDFIEILRGHPIDGNLYDSIKGEMFAESFFFDKNVHWKISKSETGFCWAFTPESGDLNAMFRLT